MPARTVQKEEGETISSKFASHTARREFRTHKLNKEKKLVPEVVP